MKIDNINNKIITIAILINILVFINQYFLLYNKYIIILIFILIILILILLKKK